MSNVTWNNRAASSGDGVITGREALDVDIFRISPSDPMT